MAQGQRQVQLSCSPPTGGGLPYVVGEDPQQPLLQPPSAASPTATAQTTLLVATWMLRVAAS